MSKPCPEFVKTPYRIGPGMIKYTGPVNPKFPRPSRLNQRLKELGRWGMDLWGQTSGSEQLVRKASNVLGYDTEHILELTQKIEQDIAILDKGRIAAIAFCFPSGFRPRAYLGMPLSEVHGHAADNDQLVRASDRIAQALAENNYQRWAWTVSATDQWSNYPGYIFNNPTNIYDLFLRWEHQWTQSLGPEQFLFMVDVNTEPLINYQLENILASIESMPETVIRYKRLEQIRAIIQAYIGTGK